MHLNQLTIESSPENPLRVSLARITEQDGFLVVDGRHVLPLSRVSPGYDPKFDIDVCDQAGNVLGVVCLRASSGDELDVAAMTDWQYAAYLSDVDSGSLGLPHRFRKNYLILEPGQYTTYCSNFRESSPLWGRFAHEGVHSITAPTQVVPRHLVAIPNLAYPTPYHQEAMLRALMQPYAFERYLKMYHLLELLFDYDVVQRVRALGANLEGVGKLFAEYQSQDLVRLRKTIQTRCNDISGIEQALNGFSAHIPQCRSIFEDYGKDTNPMKDGKFDALLSSGSFSLANMESLKIGRDPNKYKPYVLEVAAYWTFRIRCCIAHNRIGEYVMTTADEPFVANFAEPILHAVVIEAMKGPFAALPANAGGGGGQGLVGPSDITSAQILNFLRKKLMFWKRAGP